MQGTRCAPNLVMHTHDRDSNHAPPPPRKSSRGPGRPHPARHLTEPAGLTRCFFFQIELLRRYETGVPYACWRISLFGQEAL
jgi:hypothetical protein